MKNPELLFESERKLRTGEWTFFDAPIAEFMRQIALLDTAGIRGRKIATMTPAAAHALMAAICSSPAAFTGQSSTTLAGGSDNYRGELFGVPIMEIAGQTQPLVISAIPV